MFYTYVLFSEKDRELYAGFSGNLRLRIKQHQGGLVESTRDRRPLKLVYYEACLDERDAIKREIFQERFWETLLEKSFRMLSEKNDLTKARDGGQGVVKNFSALRTYPWTGHSTIMGRLKREW